MRMKAVKVKVKMMEKVKTRMTTRWNVSRRLISTCVIAEKSYPLPDLIIDPLKASLYLSLKRETQIYWWFFEFPFL